MRLYKSEPDCSTREANLVNANGFGIHEQIRVNRPPVVRDGIYTSST